jgi:hypothetical protein
MFGSGMEIGLAADSAMIERKNLAPGQGFKCFSKRLSLQSVVGSEITESGGKRFKLFIAPIALLDERVRFESEF